MSESFVTQASDMTYATLESVDDDDLRRLGGYLLGWVAASKALGHANPASSEMYIAASVDPMSQLLADIMRVCQFQPQPDAASRLAAFLDNIGALDAVAQAATDESSPR